MRLSLLIDCEVHIVVGRRSMNTHVKARRRTMVRNYDKHLPSHAADSLDVCSDNSVAETLTSRKGLTSCKSKVVSE